MTEKVLEWNAWLIFKGAEGSLFTVVNYNLYQPPNGFCFDIECSDEPIIDNPKSRDYNVESRVKLQRQSFYLNSWQRLLKSQVTEFLDYCQKQRDAYASDSIMLTMGSDFHYQDANVWYTNMDKLIKYLSDRH